MKIISVNTYKVLRITVPYSKYYKGLLSKMEYHRTIKITFEEYLKTWRNAPKKFQKTKLYRNHSNSLSQRAGRLVMVATISTSLPPSPAFLTEPLCACVPSSIPHLYLMGLRPLPSCGWDERSRNSGHPQLSAHSTPSPHPSLVPLTLPLRAW